MPRSAATHSGRIADGALAAAIVLAPVAGGSAHPTLLPVLTGLVLLAALATVINAGKHHRLGVPGLTIGLLVAALITTLQIVPLPAGLLALISPRAAELRDFVEDGLAFRPISYEVAESAREATKLLLLALVVLVAHTRARALGRPDRIVTAVVIAGLTSALVALVHRALGADRMLGLLDAARSPATLVTTFVNPNHAAGFMVMASLSAAGLALASKRRTQVIGWFAAAALLAFVSVLGFSKGGLLAMMIGVAILLGRAAPASGKRPVVLMAGGVAVATVGAVLWRLDGVIRELAGAPADPLGLAAKLGAMKDAWPMIGEHPWVGIGRGAYGSVYPAYKTYTHQYTFTHPENFVVQYLSDWGVLLGAAAIVGLGVAIGSRLLGTRSAVAAGALAGVLALLAQNLADFSLELLGVAIPCAALLGASGAGVVKTVGVALAKQRHTLALATGVAAVTLASLSIVLAQPRLDEDLAVLEAAMRVRSQPQALDALQPIATRHPANAVVAARLSFVTETSSSAGPRELARALRWSNRALYLAPTYADAHLGAGRILVRLDHRDQGFGALRRAWSLVAESPRVMDVIGEIVRLARTPQELVRALPRADEELDVIDGRELARLLRKLLVLGQQERGRAVIEAVKPLLDQLPPLQLLTVADEMRRLGDLATARALLDRRAAAMPEDAPTRLAIVDVTAQAGQLDEAQAMLEAAIEGAHGEQRSTLHRRALELALQRRDVDHARTALTRLRASMAPTDNNQLVAYLLEARVEAGAGRVTHALDALDHAVRLAPTNASTRLERARIAVSAGRMREARIDVDAVLRLDPKNAAAMALKAQLEAAPR